MKKKIVIDVPMHSNKAKSKAMKIAAGGQGVMSVSIGAENGWLEVIGEGVDSVCLANSLRKKFCFAVIISVEDVKPTPPPPSPVTIHCCPPPPPYYECRVYDDAPPPNCSIL